MVNLCLKTVLIFATFIEFTLFLVGFVMTLVNDQKFGLNLIFLSSVLLVVTICGCLLDPKVTKKERHCDRSSLSRSHDDEAETRELIGENNENGVRIFTAVPDFQVLQYSMDKAYCSGSFVPIRTSSEDESDDAMTKKRHAYDWSTIPENWIKSQRLDHRASISVFPLSESTPLAPNKVKQIRRLSVTGEYYYPYPPGLMNDQTRNANTGSQQCKTYQTSNSSSNTTPSKLHIKSAVDIPSGFSGYLEKSNSVENRRNMGTFELPVIKVHGSKNDEISSLF